MSQLALVTCDLSGCVNQQQFRPGDPVPKKWLVVRHPTTDKPSGWDYSYFCAKSHLAEWARQ
jgi:hypothetical protein